MGRFAFSTRFQIGFLVYESPNRALPNRPTVTIVSTGDVPTMNHNDYYDQYLNQVEAFVFGSSALSGGNMESVDPHQALLNNALLHFSQYSAQRTGRSAVLGDYPDPMTISYHDHPMTAYHESNRAELIFELAKNVRRSNLSDLDKRSLRHMERSLIDGDLSSFENIVRQLPDNQRGQLLARAADDLEPLGYDIFQVRAASKDQGGTVGEHDFVVSVRRGNTIVEVHSDAKVPSATIQSPDARYMPRAAASDSMPFPKVGTPEYTARETVAKSALEQMANEAVTQFAADPRRVRK